MSEKALCPRQQVAARTARLAVCGAWQGVSWRRASSCALWMDASRVLVGSWCWCGVWCRLGSSCLCERVCACSCTGCSQRRRATGEETGYDRICLTEKEERREDAEEEQKSFMASATKTIRQPLSYRSTQAAWFVATTLLFNQTAAFFFS